MTKYRIAWCADGHKGYTKFIFDNMTDARKKAERMNKRYLRLDIHHWVEEVEMEAANDKTHLDA